MSWPGYERRLACVTDRRRWTPESQNYRNARGGFDRRDVTIADRRRCKFGDCACICDDPNDARGVDHG